MNIVDRIGMEQMRKTSPVQSRDTLKVHVRITEGDKQRIQLFQGVWHRPPQQGVGSSFMVRKVFQRRRRRARFPAACPDRRKDRSADHWPRASRQALLPAQPAG